MSSFIFRTGAVSALTLLICVPTFAEPLKPARSMNPDIGINVLGLIQRHSSGGGDRTSSDRNGFSLQEAELVFTSDVDPYLRAYAVFSVKQEDGSSEFGIDPEEVFFETTSLPVVTIKGGKFKAAFGKHNALHTHAFPFIDAPLINQELLGDEGLNDVGLSASALIPASWFIELTAQGIAAGSETLYQSGHASDVAQVLSLRNLWDLSGDSTLEWSLFGTQGPNQYAKHTHAYGSDLIFKWRPAQGGKYRALIWQSQYITGDIQGRPNGTRLSGLASWIQYQFAQRWWIQARGEFPGLNQSPAIEESKRQSVLLGFFPTEFSGFRLEYDRLAVHDSPTDHRVALQWNISIGAHPAHLY